MVITDSIVVCPRCHSLSILSQTAAYSFSYMQTWTDGWTSPPMEPLPVLLCCNCSFIGWRGDYEILGPLIRPSFSCRLELLDVGDAHVAVMKLVRKITGQTLIETKNFIADLPVTLLRDAPPDEASALKKTLDELGATTRIFQLQVGKSSPQKWLNAPRLEGVSDPVEVQRYLNATTNLTITQELAIRSYIFQLWNHKYRDDATDWVPIHKRDYGQVQNAQRLFQLLDETKPEELFIKAEIAREMGQFAQAISILSNALPPEFDAGKNVLLEIVKTGRSAVCTFAVCA